jgi:cellulose synthase/poly-beta-1,6-N-acetylglucosamine synthase-like glycosyltransferase
MAEGMFWLFVLGGAYSYFIYPLALAVLRELIPVRAARAAGTQPVSMTLVVTAYNEERRIREKIENSLGLAYPQLEIIIASDSSTDRTDDIVREYAGRRVRLVRAPERLGKENAQGCAIREAVGEVIVFSDVATRIETDALARLAAYFEDSTIGAVSSEDRFITQSGEVAGEGAYVRYEMWLRRMESGLAGLVGLSGSFFAARKRVCDEWDIHSPSDFNTALNCARKGLRAVTAPDVLGFYSDLKDPRKEYDRKVRTVLRGITAIARHPDVLNVFRFGLFSWQVWSHKIMRWAVPFLAVAMLLSNLCLLGENAFYMLTFVAQLAFYSLAFAAHVNERVKQHGAVRIVYFFLQANVAIADACWRFLSGERRTTWQPSAR